MHFALARHKLDTDGLEFEHILQDIESLNRAAANATYDVTAISIHAYAYLHDKYDLLSHGASMGENYGPMIVAKQQFTEDEIKQQVVAIPGTQTSAYLALKLFAPDIETVSMPFDEILPAVVEGKVAAGLLIHEGQLTYGDEGVYNIVDMGKWWAQQTGGLPLPLGGNAIRRDMDGELKKKVSHLLRESIRYALDHREEALDYAMEYARGLETERGMADQFVGMYVNERTLDYGDDGRRATQLFLDKGFEAGVIPHKVNVEFVK
nr:menaquinone via futalosine step 4 protein [uncultured bacterium]